MYCSFYIRMIKMLDYQYKCSAIAQNKMSLYPLLLPYKAILHLLYIWEPFLKSLIAPFSSDNGQRLDNAGSPAFSSSLSNLIGSKPDYTSFNFIHFDISPYEVLPPKSIYSNLYCVVSETLFILIIGTLGLLPSFFYNLQSQHKAANIKNQNQISYINSTQNSQNFKQIPKFLHNLNTKKERL